MGVAVSRLRVRGRSAPKTLEIMMNVPDVMSITITTASTKPWVAFSSGSVVYLGF